jgi:dihydrofolate reductase
MRRTIVSEFLSLDGVMEDPGGAEGTKHGGWSLRYFSEEYGKYKFDELFACGALLLGRVTYEGFARAWPERTDEYGFADRMNSLPKYVVSTTLKKLEWNNSTLIAGNVPEEVSRLKQQPGQDILVAGSSVLVNTLMRYDLIDEYRLMVHPLVLGSGKRLFAAEPGRKDLKLVETRMFSTGTVVLVYQPARKELET